MRLLVKTYLANSGCFVSGSHQLFLPYVRNQIFSPILELLTLEEYQTSLQGVFVKGTRCASFPCFRKIIQTGDSPLPVSSCEPGHRIQVLSPDEAGTPVREQGPLHVKSQLKKRTRDREMQYVNSKQIEGLFNGPKPTSKPMQRIKTSINPYRFLSLLYYKYFHQTS